MKRYVFTTQQTLGVLNDGRTRIYFDEVIGEETIETIPEGKKEPIAETFTTFSYRAAEIPAGDPVDKASITNAIIRADYSQDEVEAIFRHRLAGEDPAEFDEFNAKAEAAKASAVEILK